MQNSMEVDAYIASAPEDQQPILERLRAMISRHFPEAQEILSDAHAPAYVMEDDIVAGFAYRDAEDQDASGEIDGTSAGEGDACPVLFIMNQTVLDRYEDQLGDLRDGSFSVEWREGDTLDLDGLEQLCERMLADAARNSPYIDRGGAGPSYGDTPAL
jgi:uncharacterized protein YdhG (YjbR/CyaY superfamily)